MALPERARWREEAKGYREDPGATVVPKGQNISAQCNALSNLINNNPSPARAKQNALLFDVRRERRYGRQATFFGWSLGSWKQRDGV